MCAFSSLGNYMQYKKHSNNAKIALLSNVNIHASHGIGMAQSFSSSDSYRISKRNNQQEMRITYR